MTRICAASSTSAWSRACSRRPTRWPRRRQRSASQTALDAYNELAASGEDTQFKKKAENLVPLAEAPFYVLTMGVCTHGSFGGYRVNTEFQVLDTDGQPIPHLYAAGEVCCGTFIYDDYPAGGCGLNWSYTSGRFSGANAAKAALA